MTTYWLTIAQDVRLSAQHISLLVALVANQQATGEPFVIYRPALMKQSRISRKETYHRYLQDLHAYKYICYEPGHRYDPTKVTLISPPNVTDASFIYPPNETHAANICPLNRTDAPVMYPPNGTDELQKEPDRQHNNGICPPNVTDGRPGQPPSSTLKKKSSRYKHDDVDADAADRRARSGTSVVRPLRSVGRSPTTADIPFAQSEFYDLDRFVAAFATDPKFADVNLDHYHEALRDWRDKHTGLPPVRTDWLATARTFIRNDRAAGRLVTRTPTALYEADSARQPLGHSSAAPNGAGAIIDRSRYRRDRPGKLGI